VLSTLASSAYAVTVADAYQAGVAYYKQGLYDQCISQEKAAVALDPDAWKAYEEMGNAYYAKGNVASALEAYHESLNINPDNPKLEALIDKEAQNAPVLPDTPANNSSSANVIPAAMATPDTKLHNSFYFNVGGATPYAPDDFTQSWGTGGSAGLAYGFALSKQSSIVLSFQYSTLTFDYLVPGVSWNGGDIHTAMGLVNGKFILVNADNPVLLYLIAGIGGTAFTIDTLTGTNIATGKTASQQGLSETDLAMRFGVGVDIRLDKGLYLTVESNGVDTFVSQAVDESALVNSQFGVGMRFDN
jgi:hypothetical protein